jgi:CRISPR-associated protein Cas1
MERPAVPWLAVSGFGRHIKATTSVLSVQFKGETREYPIASVQHLLIVGGHNVHTSAFIHLLRAGSTISFFDSDGVPLGTLRPYGPKRDETLRTLQKSTPTHSFAVEVARASLKSRLIQIENTQESLGRTLFYVGEQDFLHSSLEELEYLIKLEELRRMHKLATDMYYEVMGRSLPPELGFRRRTIRPHTDPVNAMLSLGYALLFGECMVAAVGANLDPDVGILRQGERSLILDFIDPLKPVMIDPVVFSAVRDGLKEDDYDCTTARCHLSDRLVRRLMPAFHKSIRQDIIDTNVSAFKRSLLDRKKYQLVY